MHFQRVRQHIRRVQRQFEIVGHGCGRGQRQFLAHQLRNIERASIVHTIAIEVICNCYSAGSNEQIEQFANSLAGLVPKT